MSHSTQRVLLYFSPGENYMQKVCFISIFLSSLTTTVDSNDFCWLQSSIAIPILTFLNHSVIVTDWTQSDVVSWSSESYDCKQALCTTRTQRWGFTYMLCFVSPIQRSSMEFNLQGDYRVAVVPTVDKTTNLLHQQQSKATCQNLCCW